MSKKYEAHAQKKKQSLLDEMTLLTRQIKNLVKHHDNLVNQYHKIEMERLRRQNEVR